MTSAVAVSAATCSVRVAGRSAGRSSRGARSFCRAVPRCFSTAGTVDIHWNDAKTGQVVTTPAAVGDNLLHIAHANGIDLEGACEGSVACSTCHVVMESDVFDALPEASEEEDDMLDQAFGLTDTSRLGCQVLLTEDMAGTTITLPAATRNFYVDGFVPKPH